MTSRRMMMEKWPNYKYYTVCDTPQNWREAAFSDYLNMFCLLTCEGKVYASYDCIHWSNAFDLGLYYTYGIVWHKSCFWAFGKKENDNSHTWYVRFQITNNLTLLNVVEEKSLSWKGDNGYFVVSNNSHLILSGRDSSSNPGSLSTSDNGQTWNRTDLGSYTRAGALDTANTSVIKLGSVASTTYPNPYISTNQVNFSAISSVTTSLLCDIIFNDNKFILYTVDESGGHPDTDRNIFMSSYDGENWETNYNELRKFAGQYIVGGNKKVICYYNGSVAPKWAYSDYSLDNWKLFNSPHSLFSSSYSSSSDYKSCYGNGKFLFYNRGTWNTQNHSTNRIVLIIE